MSVYQKQSNTSAVTVPELEQVPEINIKDALETLGNTIKAFQALASIYKIIDLADKLNTEMDDLTGRRNDLRMEVLKLTTEISNKNKEIEKQIASQAEIIK